MTDTVIRPLESWDQHQWRELWKAYLAFYETSLPEEVYATTWSRLLSGGEYEPRGLVAEVEGRPVGLAHYIFHRSGWSIANKVYLQDLYADPKVRGRGVGRALIEAVYAEADAAGAADVYWMTQHFNETARKLYDRVGKLTPFIEYHRG